MATTKTIRLNSAQAEWLAAEAKRARVSQNRLIEELITRAIVAGWQFGAVTAGDQP